MKKFTVALVILVIALVAAVWFFSWRTGSTPRGAELIPASTILFIHCPDLSRSTRDFQNLKIARLIHEPETREFLRQPMDYLKEMTGLNSASVENEWWFPWVTRFLWDAQKGEIFFAVTSVNILTRQVGVVMGADMKRHRLEMASRLANLKNRIQESFPNARFESKKHRRIAYDVWSLPNRTVLCQTFLGDMLVFTLGENTMIQVIERHFGSDEAGPSLASSESFRNNVSALPSYSELVAILNLQPIVSLLAPFALFSPDGAAALQQLSKLDSISFSTTFRDDAVWDVFKVAYRQPTTNESASLTGRTLALTTPDTVVYAATTTDWRAQYQQLRERIAATQKMEAIKTLAGIEDQLAKAGLNIQTGLMAHLGPETALIVNWPATEPVPAFAIATELKNAGAVDAAIPKVLSALTSNVGGNVSIPGLTWSESRYRDHTFFHFTFDRTPDLKPVLVVGKRFAVVASSPEFATGLLDHVLDGKPNLETNPSFATRRQKLDQTARAIFYGDLPAMARRAYPLIEHSLKTPGLAPYINPSLLPKVDTLTTHLFPMTITTTSAPDGVTVSSISPMGTGMIIAGATIAGSVLAFNQFQELAGEQLKKLAPTPSSDKPVVPRMRESPPAASETPSHR